MKRIWLVIIVISLFLCAPTLDADQPQFPSTAAPAATNAPTASAMPSQETPRVSAYTLPPDLYKKAHDLGRIHFRFNLISLFYGLAVLLLVLRWKLAPKYRNIAENRSSRRFVQAVVFAPLLILTIDVLELPPGIYEQWVSRSYGISVQGWPSWFWDWTKGEVISVILAILLVWILYAVIRWSPRAWWFYFWLVSVPIGGLLIFSEPLIVDPLFNKFEPLQKKDAPLTAALQNLVQHAGQDISPERMFWMDAGEKTTSLNAYVTGFGASKRIVVWDTTIAKMNTQQIVFVTGHEMGHYVLEHIPKFMAFGAATLFVFFYLTFRAIGGLLGQLGKAWEIRAVDDWASLPALLLLLSIISFVATPIFSAFSRSQEHQADQYGLEVTHGLTPDSGQIAAQTFQILGEVGLSDPDPNPINVFLFFSHPPIRDRVQFSLHYNPWSNSQPPELVK